MEFSKGFPEISKNAKSLTFNKFFEIFKNWKIIKNSLKRNQKPLHIR
jgi:hypothetical protein